MNKLNEYLDRIDDWATEGNNWRFIVLLGLAVALVIGLVWHSQIKRGAKVAYQAGIAKVAPAPAIDDKIADIIEEATPEPEPVPLDYVEKKVRCELGGGPCWDPVTERWINLGKKR